MLATRWCAPTLALIALFEAAACASPRTETAPSAALPVAVGDVRSVAGRWVGLMDTPGRARNEDQYVEVDVHPDGTYRATSARTIGFMDARGTVAVRDGRLLVRGERGAEGRATLLSHEGGPMLMVDMTLPDGGRASARLRPRP
jgi:hypothetical protein